MSLSYILSFLSFISLMNVNHAMFPSFESDFVSEDDAVFCAECRYMKSSHEIMYLSDAAICLECFENAVRKSGEDRAASPIVHSPQSTYHQQRRSPSPEQRFTSQPESQNNGNIVQQFTTNDSIEGQQQLYCSVNRKALALLAVVAVAGTYYVGKKIWHKFHKPAQKVSPAEDK